MAVIGAPLELPKIEEPSSEDVAKYHGLYMDLLLALFNKHKKEHCTNPEAELTFVGPGDFGLLA